MKKLLLLSFTIFCLTNGFAQSINPWKLEAKNWDTKNYYGVTVANGMVGIVSAQEPFKVKDVVLAGAYDLYGRGRVSNFLRSFNLLNMQVSIDGEQINANNTQNFVQSLDMKNASFTSRFDMGDKQQLAILIML